MLTFQGRSLALSGNIDQRTHRQLRSGLAWGRVCDNASFRKQSRKPNTRPNGRVRAAPGSTVVCATAHAAADLAAASREAQQQNRAQAVLLPE
jgi:hypothetical protein